MAIGHLPQHLVLTTLKTPLTGPVVINHRPHIPNLHKIIPARPDIKAEADRTHVEKNPTEFLFDELDNVSSKL